MAAIGLARRVELEFRWQSLRVHSGRLHSCWCGVASCGFGWNVCLLCLLARKQQYVGVFIQIARQSVPNDVDGCFCRPEAGVS